MLRSCTSYEVGGGYSDEELDLQDRTRRTQNLDRDPKIDSSQCEILLQGGEQVTSVLQEMITLLEDMNMDEASEEVAVELAAQGVIENVLNLCLVQLGTGLSIMISRRNPSLVTTFAFLSCGYIFSSYQEVKSVALRTLNRARFCVAVESFLNTGRVPSLQEGNKQENIFNFPRKDKPVVIGSRFKEAFQDPGAFLSIEPLFEKERYVVTYNPSKGKVYALLKDQAKADDIIKAAFHEYDHLKFAPTSADLEARIAESCEMVYMIQLVERDQDDQRKALLEVIKEIVLSHLRRKCPPHVQVVGLLCRTPQKDSRHKLMRRVAAGGGVFDGEKGVKIHIPGANLNDIANQADDLPETMESRPVPDRKLPARLVLIREEARNMMGGGILDERNGRGFSTLPESEVNFLTKLVALKPGKTVQEMIKNVMLGKDEGADSSDEVDTAGSSSSGIFVRGSVTGKKPLPSWHVS